MVCPPHLPDFFSLAPEETASRSTLERLWSDDERARLRTISPGSRPNQAMFWVARTKPNGIKTMAGTCQNGTPRFRTIAGLVIPPATGSRATLAASGFRIRLDDAQ